MPELPEVDAITGEVRFCAIGNTIDRIEIVRWNGKYFSSPDGPLFRDLPVRDVYRVGKYVVLDLSLPAGGYIIVHNAMTGYFDWEHMPWTFDYVEGRRKSTESDVRVKFHFRDGKVLRFHDSRLFGRMELRGDTPKVGPELMQTPNGLIGRPIITEDGFYAGLQASSKPVKARLMDQDFVSGVGNIYSSEGCHRAGIKPGVASNLVSRQESDLLLRSLRDSIEYCIPQVRYDDLKVYRRVSCGSCGKQVTRTEISKRATFWCSQCQT